MGCDIYIFYLLCLIVGCQTARAQVVLSGDASNIPPNPHKKDPSLGGTISMGTPDLSDEDSMSIHMPKYLNCDACRIISMRFSDVLAKEIEKFPSFKKGKKQLSEDRVLELLENVCNDEWTQYGIKEVDGVNRLSGPGFETSDVPGVMQGGGKWPFRFKQICEIILGDVGEEVIYEMFRKSKTSGIEKRLCVSPIDGQPGFCQKKPGKDKSKRVKNENKQRETKKNDPHKKPSTNHNEL